CSFLDRRRKPVYAAGADRRRPISRDVYAGCRTRAQTNPEKTLADLFPRGMSMSIRSLADLQLNELIRNKQFTPSPAAWEDQVLYFLLVDRFSDDKEKGYRNLDGNVVKGGTTEPFKPGDALNAVQTSDSAARWRDAGGGYVGGNLAGVTSK